MNCTHCGTLLPPGALFCGECGRSVSVASRTPAPAAGSRQGPAPSGESGTVLAPARWVEDPVTGESLDDDVDAATDVDVEVGAGEVRCDQCTTVMAHDDIFCPECGFVSRSITRAFSTSDFTDETAQLDFTAGSVLVEQRDARRATQSVAPAIDPLPEPEPDAPASPEPKAESAPARDSTPELEHPEPEPQNQPVWIAPPTAAAPTPAPAVPRAPRTPQAPPSRPVRTFLPNDADEDVEATRIVNRISGNRFVLQFSTGESFTVHGSGLIGRNPQPEPGEFFDHLVRVLDTGKSVSKTHLEFGQEQGAFWVKDRFSGNGTVIREPDISARRAEADRRYRVVRGTRIDIGEQFFVIS